MRILLVSSCCSLNKYNLICSSRKENRIDPEQKFFRLVAEGLVMQEDVSVRVLSTLPISASTHPGTFFHHSIEHSKGVEYEYMPFINTKLLRYITLFINTILYVIKWIFSNEEEKYIICDPLLFCSSRPARRVAKLFRVKSVAIITDIPSLATNMKVNDGFVKSHILRVYQWLSDVDCHRYDYYVTLTESINLRLNIHNRPFCIMEGLADVSDVDISESHDNYIMYAGGVYSKYGVEALLNAFIKLNRDDIQLHIYGNGSFVKEVMNVTKIFGNVKYMGCKTPSEIVPIEKKALLLVNPRPTNEEFSKYSFPSKTIEYMLSGTPVVSTQLPGIPKEYFEHMFCFEEDNENGIYNKLSELLSMDKSQLLDKGIDGHNFIIEEKTNIKMTNKIIKMLLSNQA